MPERRTDTVRCVPRNRLSAGKVTLSPAWETLPRLNMLPRRRTLPL